MWDVSNIGHQMRSNDIQDHYLGSSDFRISSLEYCIGYLSSTKYPTPSGVQSLHILSIIPAGCSWIHREGCTPFTWIEYRTLISTTKW